MAIATNLDAGVQAFFDIVESSALTKNLSPNDILIQELMGVRAELAELETAIEELLSKREKLAASLQAGVEKLLKGSGESNPTIARVMTR